MDGHDDTVWYVAFSNAGDKIASASDDQTVRLWDVSTGNALQVLRDHDEAVYAVAFSNDDTVVVSASKDELVRVWEVSTGALRFRLNGHINAINALASSPTCPWVASAALDAVVVVWDVSVGKLVSMMRGHSSGIRAVAFSKDGSRQTNCLWGRRQVATGLGCIGGPSGAPVRSREEPVTGRRFTSHRLACLPSYQRIPHVRSAWRRSAR